MTLLIQLAVLVAALVFITVSAAMNALFLSSLGRTPVEASLLAAVSIAADIAKAVLPVLLARAILLRAWGYAAATTVMLLMVVALSLASGTGFAAMTRGAVTAEREAKAEQLARRRQDLEAVETRIAALGEVKPAPLIEAQLAVLKLDRRWAASNGCVQVTGPSARTFCADVVRLDGMGRHAELHARTLAERRRLIGEIEALQGGGAGRDSDHQVSVIARAFGVAPEFARVGLSSSIALTLEVGSMILLLLASGPMLLGWREPGSEPQSAPMPATLPVQADRMHWQRQRNKLGTLERHSGERRDGHERQ